VLPPLLVLLQVPRRHAQHAAEGARHGGPLLRCRVLRRLGRRGPSLEWWGHGAVGAGVHWRRGGERGQGAAWVRRRLRNWSVPRPLRAHHRRRRGRGAVGTRCRWLRLRRRPLPRWPTLVLLWRRLTNIWEPRRRRGGRPLCP
jgi:hypothetical protein